MRRYNQHDAVLEVIKILNNRGYEAAKVFRPNIEADIILNHNDKKVHILVRHLEKDHAYKKTPRSYKIYKIEAFYDNEERNIGLKTLNFVIGYSFNDKCYACVPIEEYKDKRSTVIHEKEDTRHEYYNSFLALEAYLKKALQ